MGYSVYGGQKPEKYYQEKWCDAHSGRMEVVLKDKTRCDCLTLTHAVEVDFAKKWAEAIGQSLNYAMQTGRKAGILIIYKTYQDKKKIIKLKEIIKGFRLPIDLWIIKAEQNDHSF